MNNLMFDKRAERFYVLYALYKRVNGSTDFAINLRDAAYSEGVGYHAYRTAYNYLVSERLIEPRMKSDGTNEYETYNYYACITTKGINAAEESFREPEKDTQYFPAYRQMMR